MDDINRNKGFRRAFSNIARGYTPMIFKGQKIFIKHLSNSDYADLDDKNDEIYKEALARGLPTREERAKFLTETGEIDIIETDKRLEEIRSRIEEEKTIKEKQYLPSKAAVIQAKIDELKNEYNSLFANKEKFFSGTCEYYSERELNNQYLKISLFKNSELTMPYWGDEDDFDYVSSEEILDISEAYSEALKSTNDDGLENLALSDLGMNNWYIAGKSGYNLFGKAVALMSGVQLRICGHFSNFSNILENTKNIPPDVRYNPKKLYEFANIQNNSKDIVNNQSSALSITEATREDYEKMGFNETNSVYAEDIVSKALGDRKILGMEEMRRLLGGGE